MNNSQFTRLALLLLLSMSLLFGNTSTSSAAEHIRLSLELNRDYFPVILSIMDLDNIENYEGVEIHQTWSIDHTLTLILQDKLDMAVLPADIYIEMMASGELARQKNWKVAGITYVEEDALFFPFVENRLATVSFVDRGGGIAATGDPDALRVAPMLVNRFRLEGVMVTYFASYPENSLALQDLQDNVVDGIMISPKSLFPVRQRAIQKWEITVPNTAAGLGVPFPWGVLLIRDNLSESAKNTANTILEHISKVCSYSDDAEMEKAIDDLMALNIADADEEFLEYWITTVKYRKADREAISYLQAYSDFLYRRGYIPAAPDMESLKW